MAICPTCGRTEPAKPRSPDHHRRYFKVLALAFEHWPDTHAEKFDDLESFRAWVQMRAGHFESTKLSLEGANPHIVERVASAALKSSGTYARARVYGSDLYVYRPKSISFGRLDQKAFSELSASVETVIKVEGNLDAEELLKNADAP